ncbi:MAG: hypothetical protein GF308_05630 [Candidatus Heimdallarchaeota archaeon]|nr:hypothetical protein [Candidatus Heimdallarchaeota archaeon]
MSSKGTKKRALLVEGVFNRKEGDHLAELSELASVAGYVVVGKITQNLQSPNPNYFFGSGKVNEIKGQRKALDADIIIIENNLTGLQIDNLEKKWRVPIIDRFELILEIFINEAGSKEAITQIKLAALKRGSGRFQKIYTTQSRHSLIKKLEKKLELIKKYKDLRRKRRVESGFDLIAIAGYTNAGKSTLMNALTTAKVEVSGRMFTTLSTTTRSFEDLGRKILVTDTIGLISRLPHALVDAFYATLKEVKEADLILLIIDGSDSKENIKRKVLTSMNTLTAIEADMIPLIPLLNKIDIAKNILEKAEIVEAALMEEPILISAAEGLGLELLKEKILEQLVSFPFHIKIPNTNDGMSLVSQIHDLTRITSESYSQDFVELQFETNERLGRYLYNILRKSQLNIEILNKEELQKYLKKEEEQEEGAEDKITVIKTDGEEEIIIFDLVEEGSPQKKSADTFEKDLEKMTTLDED